MKSDNEDAIIALQKAAAAMRAGETVLIHSPVRSSKSNGRMENAVQRWQGQLRTTKHFLESRIKCKIPADSALFSWMVPFCAEIMTKFIVGNDGLTGYERITEHRLKHFVIGFGETVHFKLETEKTKRFKADSEFDTGFVLGYVWNTTEYIVGKQGSIYKCRTILRLPD